MSAQRSLWLVAGVFCLAAGCNPIYYSPNTQNVLLAPERGDLSLLAATDGNRVEMQAAYAFSDRAALEINGGIFEPADLDNGDGGSGHFVEGGVRYLTPLSASLAWEIHGLLGFGSFDNHFPSSVALHPATTGEITGDLLRFGVQPAFGYRSRYVEAAASTRLVGLRYNGVEGALIYEGEDQVEMLTSANSYFLVEPAITVRAGLERVKVQLQAARSVNLTDSDFRQDESMLTVGIVVNAF